LAMACAFAQQGLGLLCMLDEGIHLARDTPCFPGLLQSRFCKEIVDK